MATKSRPTSVATQLGLRPDAFEMRAIRETVTLAAQGMSDREIARELGCSVRTVTRRFASAMTLYGARSRFHLGFVIATTEEQAPGDAA